MSPVKRSRIYGVGYYVPPRVVKNDDLSKMMDTSDEWIQQRTGIKQRHFADEGVMNADMGVEAVNKALAAGGLKKEEIDYIIYATLSPDYEFPGTGCFLQAKLGIPGVPALDIRNQCSGFIYGLQIADALVKTGQYKRVLVVGGELHSRGLDLTTRGREVSVLFGDGAGAAIVGPSDDERGILSVHTHADGSHAKELWLEAPGCSFYPTRLTHEMIDDGRIFPKMNGKTVFLNAVKKMPEVFVEGLKATGLTMDKIDLLVPHQANLRINDAVADYLKFPKEKVFNTIDRFGNTTAATIPIGLSEAIAAGALKPGMTIGLVAFGSGFTWASAIIRW